MKLSLIGYGSNTPRPSICIIGDWLAEEEKAQKRGGEMKANMAEKIYTFEEN